MATVVKAPDKVPDGCRIFLGGSIDMGLAVNWQDKVAEDLQNLDVVLVNPRRDDWDSTWEQDPTPGTKFYEQVSWELEQQQQADILVYYFAENSKAPITLLELGLFGAQNPAKTVVYCPTTFYRHGNVKMVCDMSEIYMVETYEELISEIRGRYEIHQLYTDLACPGN